MGSITIESKSHNYFINKIEESDTRKSLELYFYEYILYYNPSNSELLQIGDILYEKGHYDIFLKAISFQKYSHFRNLHRNRRYDEISKEEFNSILEESDKAYEEIINRFIELSIILNQDNSLKISNLFTYMLYSGYFSFDYSYHYDTKNKMDIKGSYAWDIINGYGSCLSYSDMLCDILTEAKYDSAIIHNFYDESVLESINKIIKSGRIVLSTIDEIFRRTYGNHACTLIIDKGKPYIYDVTNILLFECKNKKEAYNESKKIKLNLNPYFSGCVVNNDKNLKALETLMLEENLESPYSVDDYTSSIEEDIEVYNSNENLLKDFRNDIIEDISTIKDKTKIFYYK